MSGTPTLVDANKDRIRCRDVATVTNDTVLTATGDSVTSAHFQWGFGNLCERTSFDFRNLVGDDGVFSYARRYFDMNTNIVDYDNYARTGFATYNMLFASPAMTDTCNNPWLRGVPPVSLAAARIAKAKADGHQAYHVTTGGVNNTNWTKVLTSLITCRALEYVQQRLPGASMTWAPDRNSIITAGGSCILDVGGLTLYREAVPTYDGPARYAGITADATAIVNTLLAAGADKVVWLLYYDISAANIDLGNTAWYLVRNYLPEWTWSYFPPQPTPWVVGLVDAAWIGAVRQVNNDLNTAIWAGVPFHPKVRVATPPFFTAADIQVTAKGGSPHPSAAGHDKLAGAVANAFNSIP